MGMFSSALLFDCVSCHAQEIISDPKAFSIATPRIQRARQMVVMMNTINKQYFGGQPRVTCFTCHGGGNRPKTEPNLDLQYGEPVDDPYAMNFFPSLYAPSLDAVFAKYLQALGGPEPLAKLTSFVGHWNLRGVRDRAHGGPGGGLCEGANQMTTSPAERRGRQRQGVRRPHRVETAAGHAAAAAASERRQPDGCRDRSDGVVSGRHPAGVQPVADRCHARSAVATSSWPTGRDPGQPPVRLYFDESGRLVRLVHWTTTAVGSVPTRLTTRISAPLRECRCHSSGRGPGRTTRSHAVEGHPAERAH